ncbi:MAG: VWA domain-containing protein [Planctomycetes bacterium]|nr:VWA domain-containing protein [Planctomycetota bacterium]
MKFGPVASDPARLSAGVLALTFVGVVTGALPLAGLSFAPRAQAHAPAPATPVPSDALVAAFVQPADRVVHGPLRLEATLGQRLVHAGDGLVDLVVGVTVDDDAARRGPVDLALVVDTSGSMAGVIGLVRRATLGVIERLGPDDRLVLVTYSDDARTVFQGAVTPASRGQVEAAVARFVAARGTNIAAGLEAGRAGLRALGARPGRTARLLLLSDGAPTVGETSPAALTRAAAALRQDGVALSSVGLGVDYGEALMAAMADAGGGEFHHVDGPGALAKVYAAELEALRAVALRGARLRLLPAEGVEVLSVTAWGVERQGGEARVSLGDLSHGRGLKVVARLKVPAGAQVQDVVRARLEGAGDAGDVALETARLSVGLTADARLARESAVPEVERDLRQAAVAARLQEARAAAARGEGERARALVREARAEAREDCVTFEGAGEVQRVNLDALADELAEGAASDRGRRAMKAAMAAERGAGRAR